MSKVAGRLLPLACLAVSISLGSAVAQRPEPDKLFPIFENGKLGYINQAGKVVIEPRFDRVNLFSVEYELIQFSEGLAGAKYNDKWGFIDAEGRWVVEPRFDNIRSFSEGLAGVEVDGKWGFINKAGEVVIEPRYKWIDGFSDGLAAVDIVLGDDDDGQTVGYGYIDKTGSIAIRPTFDMTYGFSEGLAPVMLDGKMGYVNTSGEMVIRPRFGLASKFSDGVAEVTMFPSTDVGFIDKAGKWVVRPRFDLANDFSDGTARVVKKIDDEYLNGYVDKTGRVFIEPRFKESGDFSEGVARVKIGDKEGYMGKAGELVIAAQFDSAGVFMNGLARVRKGDTVGYINRSGEFVWSTSTWDAAPAVEMTSAVRAPARAPFYFPPLSFSDDEESNEFSVEWYSKHLEAMREPSLWRASESGELRAYRFTWLRSFNHPVVVRLDLEKDGTGILTAKVTTGAGGYEPGEIRTNKTLKLNREQTGQFLRLLEKAKFWAMPSWKGAVVRVEKDGTETIEINEDGAQWIIEGVENGKYHVVDRWSPKKGAYREAALLLIRLANLKIKEIY